MVFSNEMMYFLYITYILLVVSSIFVVVAETGNAAKSTAWILALIFLPGLGLLLYILFGQNLQGKKLLSRVDWDKLSRWGRLPNPSVESLPISSDSKQLISMCTRLGMAYYYPDNDVRVYLKGREKFDDLIADIRNAKSFIHIQYFIFRDDALGREVAQALVDAVERGVEVRLLYDDMGCITVDRNFFKKLRKKGVEVRSFMRVFHWRPLWRINYRNHRKVVVIDGHVGYIGGMNIADRYVNGDEDNSWRDTHMRIEGPAVRGLQVSFTLDWAMEKEFLDDERYYPPLSPAGNKGVQIIASGPIGGWDNIEFACAKAISMTRNYVYIQTPYFLPTDSLLNTLQIAALSGVDVRVMIPNMTDWKVMRYGSFSYVSQLLSAGVKVYLYMPGMLHSKTIVVDDEMLSIGSANFDFRSFEHNFEANALVYDDELAKQAKADFFNDMQHCVMIESLEQWRKRPFMQKVGESIVRLISPVL